MKIIALPNSRSLTTSIRATALVFEDPRSKDLLERLEIIAPSDVSVLINGDTGTGKELIARHIHALSNRHSEAFIPVNCGALTESLVESELFGHEKGAFTGASSQRIGWFEAAQGGTIFLDEIGDLPLPIQVKLLRVLQEREVYRLGSRKPIPIDVRIIAATNVVLDDAVAAGRFREDLLYRLRVASIELLPLRERTGDILPIAQYFVREYSQRQAYQGHIQISKAAENKLLSHPWPGNIRELENVIHYALLVCKSGMIEPDNLHLSLPASAQHHRPPSFPDIARDALDAALIELFEKGGNKLFEQIENAVFSCAYRYCQGNQLQTARLLDISRHVVRARLLRSGDLQSGSETNEPQSAPPIELFAHRAISPPIIAWGETPPVQPPRTPSTLQPTSPNFLADAGAALLMQDWPG